MNYVTKKPEVNRLISSGHLENPKKVSVRAVGNKHKPTYVDSIFLYLKKSGLTDAAMTRFSQDLTYSCESRGRALSVAEAFVFAQLWGRGYLDSFTSEPASEHAIYESGYAFGYAEGQHPIEDNDHDYTN
jgi:hypothetical protein